MKRTTETHPDAYEALLPWYATGRLSAEDRALVADALEDDEDLALQLRLIEEDREATILLNEEQGSPGSAVWDRISSVTTAEPRKLSIGARLAQWLGLEAGAPHTRLAWAGAAAAIAIVAIQGAATLTLMSSSGGGYHTASAQVETPAPGAQALVVFAPDARIDQVATLLAETHGVIVEGPRGGFYKLRFGDAPLDKAALDATLAKLRANPIVKMALPASSDG